MEKGEVFGMLTTQQVAAEQPDLCVSVEGVTFCFLENSPNTPQA